MSGATGFVGSWLTPRLERAGHEVVAVGHEVEICDAEAVERSIAGARPDALVHLAGLASVARSLAEPERAARVNYLGALHVLRAAAARAPGARVLLVGSGEVYGEAPAGAAALPFTESTPLAPRSPYARAKAAADLAGAAFAARGLDVVRARPFNHLGPGQSDAFVAASFARQIAEIEAGRRAPLLRVGNLEGVRDFLDVRDVVEAYARLLERSVPAGAYNVASGTGTSIRALLEGLLAASPAKPALEVDSARWRPAGVAVGDATRLARATGWRPRVALTDTLSSLLGHWRERVGVAR